ncbi:hypothetical protein LAZ67_8001969 [Cordylochernes scorpioides]|uniref:Uncharacterized protein n=1 Tax=Cordylochernes scorpioides TaxID=51811 RepID=A0ABY6KR43_9ARAC|nr:hypothetical protein LAZ67_8001969 [Cordylochernes scorpioides]
MLGPTYLADERLGRPGRLVRPGLVDVARGALSARLHVERVCGGTQSASNGRRRICSSKAMQAQSTHLLSLGRWCMGPTCWAVVPRGDAEMVHQLLPLSQGLRRHNCDRRDIVLYKRGSGVQRINEFHRSYDALQYPLVFWNGQDGYHFHIPQLIDGVPSAHKTVSCMDFYDSLLMIRSRNPGITNWLLAFGDLTHQILVDIYAKVESERLHYISAHQAQLRATEYINLLDAIRTDRSYALIGRQVILPSSFVGSPRHMHEYAQDCMAYVRKYGRPDLFITFTCNPEWPDIKLMQFLTPRYVVPYSPLLCKLFDAHINVESCASISAIKYIFKYIYKGSDQSIFAVTGAQTESNEVVEYQHGRYFSSNEAVWRILGFPIHRRHPMVQHLSVHLKNGQRVYFTSANAALQAHRPPKTTLTEFFALCQRDNFAKTLLYVKVPVYYIWSASKAWQPRKQGTRIADQVAFASDAIGRIYTVHPNFEEWFYLRMLLHSVRGPTSFAALRKINAISREFNPSRNHPFQYYHNNHEETRYKMVTTRLQTRATSADDPFPPLEPSTSPGTVAEEVSAPINRTAQGKIPQAPTSIPSCTHSGSSDCWEEIDSLFNKNFHEVADIAASNLPATTRTGLSDSVKDDVRRIFNALQTEVLRIFKKNVKIVENEVIQLRKRLAKPPSPSNPVTMIPQPDTSAIQIRSNQPTTVHPRVPARSTYAQTLKNSVNHVKIGSDTLSFEAIRAKIAKTPQLKSCDVTAVTGKDKKLVLHFPNSAESKRFVDGFKTANIDGLKVLPNPTFRPRLAIFGIPVEKSESDLVSDLMENPVIAPQLINNSGGLKLVKLIRKEGSPSTAIIEVNKGIEEALLARGRVTVDFLSLRLAQAKRVFPCGICGSLSHRTHTDGKKCTNAPKCANCAVDSQMIVFKCLQINIRRSQPCLYSVLNDCREENIDLLLLQELPAARGKIPSLPIPSNRVCYGPITNSRLGAMVIVVNPSLKFVHLSHLSSVNVVFVMCELSGKSILLCNVYLPPSCDPSPLLDKINYSLNSLNYDEVIFCGDLNVESFRWSDKPLLLRHHSPKRDLVENFIDANYLHVLNTHGAVTWEEGNRSSSIDVTCCSAGLVNSVTDWHPEYQELSDHKRLVFNLNFAPSSQDNTRFKLNKFSQIYFSFGRADWDRVFEHFSKKIENINLFLENVRDSSSLDDVINLLGEEIFHTCLNTIPSRPRSDKYLKSISWWKSDLNPLKRATQKAQRAFIKARGVVKGVLEVFYKRLKARYRRARRLAKKEAWRAACSRCEISPWGGIYSFIKGNFKRKPLSALPVGSGFTEGPRDTLNHVLDYYFGRIPPDTMLEHKDLSKVIASSSDNDPLFTDNELLLTADKVNLSSSPGSDGMPPLLIVKLVKHFRTFFLSIFNMCLTTGHFPSTWKLGDVVLVPKRSGEDFLASHRPITMLPGLGKILERLILARLSWMADRMCKAPPNQFGFKPCRSTTAALLNLKSTITRTIKNRKSCLLLSFDVKGAFDNVLHSSILRALHKSVCPRNIYHLINSFLCNRVVRLSMNGCTVSRRISKGCPQGSVLGPFLWNIVFDELLTLDYRNNVFPQAYADDLVVVVSGCRPSQLPAAQHTIDMIARWCSLHKLELSVGKCQAMVLLRPHGRLPEPRRDLVIHGRPIQWCDSIKVLGVRFDQRLSFYQHVVEVCAKVRGMLPRLTAAANLNFGFGYRALRTLYLQVVVPAIAYASAVWFPNLSQRSLNVLLSAQRPFLVRACRAFRSTSNAALISLSRVLPLDLEILAKTELYLKKYGLVDAEIPLEPPPFPHPLPYPPYYSAPSNIPALFFHVAYYTDGSKTRDGVGAGVYRFSCLDCAPEIRESHVLSPHCSVFQAEALGLVKALENATTLPNHLTLGFFLDNLSVVRSVLNSKTGNYLIDRALLLISRLNRNGNRCTIQWIKGHSGNVGNDIADTLAKRGAESADPSCYKLAPLSFVKSAIYGRAREAWESRFLSLAPSIHTRFGLTPMSLLDKRYAYIVPSEHIVVGLLTGHTWTDSFAHRIGVIDDPSCPYCDADREETLSHIVLECSSLDALRFPLLSTCAEELGYTPRSLKDFIFNRSTWRACLEFLKASDRLKPRVRAEDSDHLNDSDSSPHG